MKRRDFIRNTFSATAGLSLAAAGLSRAPKLHAASDQQEHYVDVLYSEMAGTGCIDITWWSNSETFNDLEWRPRSGGDWQKVSAVRVLPWPNWENHWTHTVSLQNLEPDSEIEVRVLNSGFSDFCYVPPSSNLRIGWASDWQRPYDFSATSPLGLYGDQMKAQGVHAVIQGGDYVDDDGRFGETFRNRWIEFMGRIAAQWRRGDALLPIVWVMGNHEARRNPSRGPGNAMHRGDGIPGQLPSLVSVGYRANQGPSGPFLGTFCIIQGEELAIIGLETDHTVPLYVDGKNDQLSWFQKTLKEVYPKVRHILVVGHSYAYVAKRIARRDYETQMWVLRARYWPAMEPYADKIAFYLNGHAHYFTDSAPKIWPEGKVEPISARLWETVSPGKGIRDISVGPAGAINSDSPQPDRVNSTSVVDGSIKIAGGSFGHSTTHNETNITGPVKNWSPESRYAAAVMNFNSSGWNLDIIGPDGTVYYELSDQA